MERPLPLCCCGGLLPHLLIVVPARWTLKAHLLRHLGGHCNVHLADSTAVGTNEQLRSAVASRGFNNTTLAYELGIDPKTVQRWINEGRTPRRGAADKVATLLDVPPATLWPELGSGFASEVVHLYPRRADAPKPLWRQLVTAAQSRIEFMTYASAFFAEAVPDAVALMSAKAADGLTIRINLGDPDSAEAIRRGEDEGIDVPGPNQRSHGLLRSHDRLSGN